MFDTLLRGLITVGIIVHCGVLKVSLRIIVDLREILKAQTLVQCVSLQHNEEKPRNTNEVY